MLFELTRRNLLKTGAVAAGASALGSLGLNRGASAQQKKAEDSPESVRSSFVKRTGYALAFLAMTLTAPVGANAAEAPMIDMVSIPGGAFSMGSPESEESRGKDETLHEVRISGFSLARFAVTQAQYAGVMNGNPAAFQGDDLPVENVSWFDAVRFCNALSERTGLTPVYAIADTPGGTEVRWNRDADGYRLPTEAEWEYAARAGTVSPFHTGGNITVDQANYYGTYPYRDAPRGRYRERTVAVGSLPPNPWGLYEMHGNVWEWCWDWYGAYPAGTQTDPAGTETGTFRVNRGGGWNDFGRHLRTAYRAAHNPENRTFNIGFRVARNAG